MKIYGDWFDEQMRKRAQRDGITGLQRAVVKHGTYAVRGYVTPATKPIASWKTEDECWYYRMRRDGRVEKSWGPIPTSDVLERGEPLEMNPYWAWGKSL